MIGRTRSTRRNYRKGIMTLTLHDVADGRIIRSNDLPLPPRSYDVHIDAVTLITMRLAAEQISITIYTCSEWSECQLGPMVCIGS